MKKIITVIVIAFLVFFSSAAFYVAGLDRLGSENQRGNVTAQVKEDVALKKETESKETIETVPDEIKGSEEIVPIAQKEAKMVSFEIQPEEKSPVVENSTEAVILVNPLLDRVSMVTASIAAEIMPLETVSLPVVIEPSEAEIIEPGFINLAESKYISSTSVGWSTFQYNKNPEGNTISLVVDGKVKEFDTGIGAHAPSAFTVNIQENVKNYPFLVCTMGIDASRGGNGNIIITAEKSLDGVSWEKIYTSGELKGNTEAELLRINVSDAAFVRFSASSNGDKTADHAVFVNLCLTKENVNPTDLDAYVLDLQESYGNPEGDTLNLLRNEFVSRYGYYTIQRLAKNDINVKNVVNRLMNDEEALLTLLLGGGHDANTNDRGSYAQSLQILGDLYGKYTQDFDDLLYRKMMHAISIVFGKNINSWTGGGENADPVERYEIYKYMVDEGLLAKEINFADLSVEEMRWVFNNQIDNDEILWLNTYARNHKVTTVSAQEYEANNKHDPDGLERVRDYQIEPYPHIAYNVPHDYKNAEFYDESLKDYWTARYDLSPTVIYGNANDSKIWMVMELGGVCGATAKLGSNLRTAFGIPSVVVGQPGHAAFLAYSEDENGNGKWHIGNDISGWVGSEKGERALLNWGSQPWNANYGVSYTLLAQQALNNYDDYAKATQHLWLANSYEDLERRLDVLNQGLQIMPYHIDLLYTKIQTLRALGASSSEFLKIAKDISASDLKWYPIAYNDVMDLLSENLEGDDIIIADMRRQASLVMASNASQSDTLQCKECRIIANNVLGKSNAELASFSFDGENANRIVINSKYDQSTINIGYSLDGTENYIETNDHIIDLTDRLEEISAEDGIRVTLMGSGQVYTIAIQDGGNCICNLNDDENRIMGDISNLEYSFDGEDFFTYTSDIRFAGDQDVYFRKAAHGTTKTSGAQLFSFTDNDTAERRYIPIEHLAVCYTDETQPGQGAELLIDGKIDKNYHTKWQTFAPTRSVVIEVEEPVYLSGIDYVPNGLNGRIKTIEIQVSMDNEQWESVVTQDFANDESVKSVSFEGIYAKYIKMIGIHTYGNAEGEDKYLSALEIKLFEDSTVNN